MRRDLHNHLPDKITENVNKLELEWKNLMVDISNVQEKAQKSYEPYNSVASSLENLAQNHNISLTNPIQKDFNQLVNLSRYANNKYYGNPDEGEEETVKHYIVKLQLLELFDIEKVRNKLGEDLDLLRYLEKIDEDRFYDAYKPAIDICSTKGGVWSNLDSPSYQLLSRLKFRAFEDTITSLKGTQDTMANKVELLFSLLNSQRNGGSGS